MTSRGGGGARAEKVGPRPGNLGFLSGMLRGTPSIVVRPGQTSHGVNGAEDRKFFCREGF